MSSKTYIPHLLAIGLLWAAAMSMDYADEVAAERENAQRMSATHISRVPAETFKPEERSSK